MTSLKSPPGPRGHWLVGSLREVKANRLAFFRRCFDEFGDAASFRMANRRAILLSHPDDIERVLVVRLIPELNKQIASLRSELEKQLRRSVREAVEHALAARKANSKS